MVVFLHNPFLPNVNFPSIANFSHTITTEYFLKLITESIPMAAVPCFFFISGFLFFLNIKNFDKATYKNKISRRIYSLAIPYFIWNIIYVINDIACNYAFKSNSIVSVINEYFDQHSFIDIFIAPIDGPLWYVRDLMTLCILSPIFYIILRKRKGGFFLILLYLIANLSNTRPNLAPSVFFYFLAGAFLSIKNLNIIKTFRHFEVAFYAISILSLFIVTLRPNHFFIHLYFISAIISLFNIASHILETGAVKIQNFLTQSVFFILAFHANPILTLYNELHIPTKAAELMGGGIMYLFGDLLTPIVKIIFCLIIFALLKKIAPGFTNMLIGKRKNKSILK